MKNKMKMLVILLSIVMLVVYDTVSYSDPPGGPDPPSVPGGSHGEEGSQVAAPIDGGLTILLLMGIGYGISKSRKGKRRKSFGKDFIPGPGKAGAYTC